MVDQQYKNDNLQNRIKDLENLLKEKQRELEAAFDIKKKMEEDLLRQMEQH